MTVATDRPEVEKVKKEFGEGLLKVKVFREQLFLCVKRQIIAKVLELLKSDPDLDYSYFSECVGVDYSTWDHERDLKGRFEVVYNLFSIKNRSRIFVKVAVDDGEKIPTCKHVFLGAEYPEREINDLFGVVFDGNEQTTRFLLPDDWSGYPLRKEYPLGGEDVLFDKGSRGPAVEDMSTPHAGESFEGKTGSEDVSGR
jgi:NADH-quinone oxidoreductase subunit C